MSAPQTKRGRAGGHLGHRPRPAWKATALAACATLLLGACAGATAASVTTPGAGSGAGAAGERAIRGVTTTGILADFAREVGGDRVQVTQMVPNGADPHSHEPSLRTIRDVAYADIAFSNYMMLEQHSIIRTLDANLPPGATAVSVAEEAAKQGATIIPLVEDRSLDTVWLGMRVHGSGEQFGATRSSTVDLQTTNVDGPGEATSYLTTTFGAPEVAFASSDGFDAARGYVGDTATLPANAHQHMSWAFTEAGLYRVTFQALLRPTDSAQPVRIEQATAVFAVGTSPDQVAQAEHRQVISAGHADITVDLDEQRIALAVDARDADTGQATRDLLNLADVVIEVPPRTLDTIPADARFTFMGTPGDPVYMLPQAVLGKHVHGDIDPHLWHDVHNAIAYVKVIRDHLIEVDPAGEPTYRTNAATYLRELDQLDAHMAAEIASIPRQDRQLVTTSDAYGYLANAYELTIAGFVAPNPGVEPSVADRIRLSTTVRDLNIPAVFLEPNLAKARSTLKTLAEDAGISVCPLYGDTLDGDAPTYIDMMRANAASLRTCLAPGDAR